MAAYIALFGGVFALIMAMGQAFVRRPDWKNVLLGLFWLSAAAWQIAAGWGALVPPGGRANNLSIIVGTAASAFTGPLYYLVFYRSIVAASKPRKKDALHFMVSGAAPLPFLASILGPGGLDDPDFANSSGTLLASFLCAGLLMAYLLLTFFRLHRLARGAGVPLKPLLNVIRAMTALAFLLSIWLMFFWSVRLNATTTGLLVLSFWFSIRNPRLFHLLRREVEKEKYARSRLGKLDTDHLVPRLRDLMAREKLYAREDIRLKDIAARLNLSEYQLSEILNSKVSMGFHAFLNSYRIAEARRLLTEDREISALAVGLKVGFNSNSSFYSAFRAETGMSPGQYRKSLKK